LAAAGAAARLLLMLPRMNEHGVEVLLGLVFFGLIILLLWTSF
jgi:hypothetical protein